MKSKAILLTVLAFVFLTATKAQHPKQTLKILYGPNIKYGWSEDSIISFFIEKSLYGDVKYTHIPSRTKDSIIVIQDFEGYHTKTSCYLVNDSVTQVKIKQWGKALDNCPMDLFFDFIDRRKLRDMDNNYVTYGPNGMWTWDVVLYTQNKNYGKFDRDDALVWIKKGKANLQASRWVLNNMTTVNLAYDLKSGYYLDYMFKQMW